MSIYSRVSSSSALKTIGLLVADPHEQKYTALSTNPQPKPLPKRSHHPLGISWGSETNVHNKSCPRGENWTRSARSEHPKSAVVDLHEPYWTKLVAKPPTKPHSKLQYIELWSYQHNGTNLCWSSCLIVQISALQPAENLQNLAWSRFSTIYSTILHSTGQLPANYRINIHYDTNTNELNGAILVSRPIWQEQGQKLLPKATRHISGPAAFSFSTQSMNCHQTTR